MSHVKKKTNLKNLLQTTLTPVPLCFIGWIGIGYWLQENYYYFTLQVLNLVPDLIKTENTFINYSKYGKKLRKPMSSEMT